MFPFSGFSTNSSGESSCENVFSSSIQVIIKNDTEERKTNLDINIEKSVELSKKVIIRLTNNTDLYFLYNLVIKDDDFQVLKMQQGLLIDFGTFPQKFVNLLELCLQEQFKEVPKFLLTLIINRRDNSFGSGSSAVLNVIETNPFKHLTHLSLKLMSGSDEDVKKYLGNCLKSLKEEKLAVERKLASTESELRQKCDYSHELLSSRAVEIEKLRQQLKGVTSEMSSNQSDLVRSHQEQISRMQSDHQIYFEKEKKEIYLKYQQQVNQLEEQVTNDQAEIKMLRNKLSRSESTVHDVSMQLSRSENELHKCRTEIQNVREDNSKIDALYRDREKSFSHLQTRVAVLEQESNDKEQVLAKCQELLRVTQEHKIQCEKQLEEKTSSMTRRENSLKTLSEEVKKANEIIAKLQKEIKANHSKLKVRSHIATEQEHLLSEKENILKRITNENKELEESISKKDAENSNMKSEFESLQEKFEQAEKLLKTNENVINWMNKQLNEAQSGQIQKSNRDKIQPRVLTYHDTGTQPALPLTVSNNRLPPAMKTADAAFNRPISHANIGPMLNEKYLRRTIPTIQTSPDNQIVTSTPGIRAAQPKPPVSSIKQSSLASAYFPKTLRST